jgi:hypothetical protein
VGFVAPLLTTSPVPSRITYSHGPIRSDRHLHGPPTDDFGDPRGSGLGPLVRQNLPCRSTDADDLSGRSHRPPRSRPPRMGIPRTDIRPYRNFEPRHTLQVLAECRQGPTPIRGQIMKVSVFALHPGVVQAGLGTEARGNPE